MKYYKAYPSEQLAPFIKNYWGIETVFEGTEPYLHRIIPTGLPELIFYLDHKPNTSDKRKLEDKGILNVQQNDYYDLIISDNLNIFSIYFRPEAVNLFFNFPMGQFFNSGVALSQLNGKLAYELQERLLNTEYFHEKVAVAEEFLLQRVNNMTVNMEFKQMQYVVRQISESKGQIRIDKLIEKSCLSRKQFERKFITFLGVSPKQYLKIIRFQSSLYEYSMFPNSSLTELAYKSGYYDQAHFVNDVKSYTGELPKKIFTDNQIISDFFDV